jgi:hypothetical protein
MNEIKTIITLLAILCVACIAGATTLSSAHSFLYNVAWAVAQLTPSSSTARRILQKAAWDHWDRTFNITEYSKNETIPTVDVQKHRSNLAGFLEKTYGVHWRTRPLLLKGLWKKEELLDPDRRLSLSGLLNQSLEIPYFSDARIKNSLSPDSKGSVGAIVANISNGGAHKIGTQFIVQTYPDLISEVAPTEIVTELFGDFFKPDYVKGSGPFSIFPALTTVPMFVANGQKTEGFYNKGQPYTPLHCEPIGNVAVQLSGTKEWTLIRPEFSFLVKPSTAPDGRAFFASWASKLEHVPTYSARTNAGDAIWVPTWTWHRVDYVYSPEISIGGSLFHFRTADFARNNPLFAILMIPAILFELVGYSTQ